MIEIVEVTSRQQYRAFFQFPFELYRNCAQWGTAHSKRGNGHF